MKKSIIPICILVTALSAFVSCQKEESVSPVNNIKTVSFFANVIETRTAFGTPDGTSYPTLWTSNDENIKVAMNYENASNAKVVPSSDFKTASFDATFTDDGSKEYTFLALSPSTSFVSISKDHKSWNLSIPTSQTPLENSVDEAAQILASTSNPFSEFPDKVSLSFKHVTAYGKLSFTNLSLGEGENVSSISLTAEEDWAGRWYYYPEDNSVSASSASATITLITSKTQDIWFACAPVDLGGKTISITVATDKEKTYSKTITIPAGKKFQSGKIASFTVDMDGITSGDADVYTLIKDVSSLTLGSKVLIAYQTASVAAGIRGTNTYLAAQAVTINDEKISAPSNAVEVFTIDNGNIPGTYSLKCASEGKYLGIDDGTKIKTSASISDAASWAIIISEDGTASIRNMGDPARYLLSNTGTENRFSTYVPNTINVYVSIFKNLSTGSGSITPKIESSISVSDATVTYNVNDVFSFDGLVTLTYSDLSTKDVTADISVDVSKVDMANAGTYPVTVSYNDFSVSYNIEVQSNDAVIVWSDDFSTVSGTSGITELNGSLSDYTDAYSGLSKVYSMTGAIRIGTASGAGNLSTPALSNISSESANLIVSFSGAGWNGKTAKLTLTASVGTVTEGQTQIISESTMAGTSPSMTGSTYTFHVTGATKNTVLTFATTNSIGIDNLVIKQIN